MNNTEFTAFVDELQKIAFESGDLEKEAIMQYIAGGLKALQQGGKSIANLYRAGAGGAKGWQGFQKGVGNVFGGGAAGGLSQVGQKMQAGWKGGVRRAETFAKATPEAGVLGRQGAYLRSMTAPQIKGGIGQNVRAMAGTPGAAGAVTR